MCRSIISILKGGERLGDKEGSEEEEEVIPAWVKTPEVRPLASGAFYCGNRPLCCGEVNDLFGRVAGRERAEGVSGLDSERGNRTQQPDRRSGSGRRKLMFWAEQNPFIGLNEDLFHKLRVQRMSRPFGDDMADEWKAQQRDIPYQIQDLVTHEFVRKSQA